MPRTARDPAKEFAELADRSTDAFAAQFFPLLRAIAENDAEKRERALNRLAKVLGETMAMGDLVGRRRALLEFDAAVSRLRPADLEEIAEFAGNPVIPAVPFASAIDDLLRREPRLAGTAAEVAELYSTRHAFALARSADTELTQAVQRFIGSSIADGLGAPSARKIVQGLGDFTRSYATTVYRTNLNTAYTAGRFQQSQQPGVRQVLPAFQRFSILDSALRRGRADDGPKGGPKENHRAAHGLIADTQDPIWQRVSPPSGYSCRCGIRLVSRSELRRKGLLTEDGQVIRFEPPGFSQFQPHPNFGRSRPDFTVYSGGTIT